MTSNMSKEENSAEDVRFDFSSCHNIREIRLPSFTYAQRLHCAKAQRAWIMGHPSLLAQLRIYPMFRTVL